MVAVYDVGEWEGQAFIASAYYEGETLERRLARGPLDLASSSASSASSLPPSMRRTRPASSIAI